LDSVDHAELTIDGESLGATIADFASYRTPVTAYTFTAPADILYTFWGYPFEGECESFADGFYVPFELSVGEHELHLVAGEPDGWSLDTTYHLTVE
jgi:hypothetical protein